MTSNNQKISLSIRLSQQTYPIYIGENLLSFSNLSPHIVGRQILIITNETIAPLHLKKLDALKETYECHQYILPDGEIFKSHKSWYDIHEFLVKNKFHRDCTIIALGGGVVGDLAGFVAATYQRGVNFIQIPTTLLSQVDSSVGGKTAINHPLGKNMIGSFYHPSVVLIDLSTLKTLPQREFNAGLAEVIKYGLLDSEEFLFSIEQFLKKNDYLKAKMFPEIIERCCKLKAKIVNQDEKETGIRTLLNLGHTFAHAIETYTQYNQLLHGEAVAIGLYCAAILSELCGYVDNILIKRIDRILEMANLPRRISKEWSNKILLKTMKQDKKVKDNKLRLILIRDIGDCFVEKTISDEQILQTLLLATEGEL